MRSGSRSSRVAALVDTNIVVYAYDAREPAKQERAKDLLGRLELRGAGAVSVQVLGEFYVTATRKLLPPLSAEEAAWNVDAFARAWTVFPIDAMTVVDAIRANATYRLPYHDGLIWATAKLNRVPTVLSEDFSDGRLIEGVRFLNPFVSDFDPAALA